MAAQKGKGFTAECGNQEKDKDQVGTAAQKESGIVEDYRNGDFILVSNLPAVVSFITVFCQIS